MQWMDLVSDEAYRRDSSEIHYATVWDALNLSPQHTRAADRIVRCFAREPAEPEGCYEGRQHSTHSSEWRTREALIAAGGKEIVDLMLENRVLVVHRRWGYGSPVLQHKFRQGMFSTEGMAFDRHPKALYRLNDLVLVELE